MSGSLKNVFVLFFRTNRGTLDLSYIYRNRVGQSLKGKKYNRVIATWPSGQAPMEQWDDIIELYKEIDGDFFRGIDYFVFCDCL